jgi:hypothetical protein
MELHERIAHYMIDNEMYPAYAIKGQVWIDTPIDFHARLRFPRAGARSNKTYETYVYHHNKKIRTMNRSDLFKIRLSQPLFKGRFN